MRFASEAAGQAGDHGNDAAESGGERQELHAQVRDIAKKLKFTSDGSAAKISLRLTGRNWKRARRRFAAAHQAAGNSEKVAVPLAPVPTAPVKPGVIRIEGLDDGPREIPLPDRTDTSAQRTATYIGDMAKDKRQLVEVRCPCCEATLQVDPELKAVISYEEHQKPPAIEDIDAAVQKMKGEEARRGEISRSHLISTRGIKRF